MTRAFARDLSAAMLVCLGLGATVAMHAEPGLCPRTLAFAAATLTAWGTTATWGLGLLAALLGLSAHPFDLQPIFPTAVNTTAVVLGIGVGLLGRHLARERWSGPLRPETASALGGLALGLLFLVQPSEARLADSSGAPLRLQLDLIDPSTLVPALVDRHLGLPVPHPLEPLLPILSGLLIVTAWIGFARLGPPRLRRTLSLAAGGLGALLAAYALLTPLLMTPELDLDAARQLLTMRSGGHGAITAVTLSDTAHLAPWSRPPLDALRLVVALGLLALSARPRAASGLTVPSGGLRTPTLAAVALTLAVALGAMQPEVAAAGALGTLATLLTARSGTRLDPLAAPAPTRSSPAPQVALLTLFFGLIIGVSLAPLTP